MGGPAKIGKAICYWADNFYAAPFNIKGKDYISSQCYFQAMKTTNEEDHELVRLSGAGQLAWEAGAGVALKHDWQKVKVRVMYEGNLQKFKQNERIKQQLIQTTQQIKFGISYFGLFFIPLIMFWFRWNALILTRVRAQLRSKDQQDLKTVHKIEQLMRQYESKSK